MNLVSKILKNVSIGVATAVIAHAPAFAGAISGGGGKSVVCRDTKGKIKSVELLDLWEARTIYGLSIPKSDAPVADQVRLAIDNLRHVLPNKECTSATKNFAGGCGSEGFATILDRWSEQFVDSFFPSDRIKRLRDVTLRSTPDSFEDAFPNGCPVEQTVIYHDNGHVLINQDLVDKMDAQNQAALYVHEILYGYLRRQGDGEPNSLRTRRAVGMALSGHRFPSFLDTLPETFADCTSGWAGPFPAVVGETQILIAESRDTSGKQKFTIVPVRLRKHVPMGYRPERFLSVEIPGVKDLESLVRSIQTDDLSDMSWGPGMSWGWNVSTWSPIDAGLSAGIVFLRNQHGEMNFMVNQMTSPWLGKLEIKDRLRCEMKTKANFEYR